MSAIDSTVARDAAYEMDCSDESAFECTTVSEQELFNFGAFSSKSIAFDNPFYRTRPAFAQCGKSHLSPPETPARKARKILQNDQEKRRDLHHAGANRNMRECARTFLGNFPMNKKSKTVVTNPKYRKNQEFKLEQRRTRALEQQTKFDKHADMRGQLSEMDSKTIRRIQWVTLVFVVLTLLLEIVKVFLGP